MHVWLVGFVEYVIDAGVDVTTLHWTCTKDDGGDIGSSYGTVAAIGHYPDIPSIKAVAPVTWEALALVSLGEEEVQRIEDDIDAQIAEIKTPTGGGFVPS